ncbi:MAG: adenine glycosylase, partial [Anaerotardibacter sp.]
QDYQGKLPDTYEELIALPGIGKATAAGVLCFAYNKPALYLETNVRSVFLHEFFPCEEEVSDKQLEPLVISTCPSDNPREWYYALLDYGNYLKATLPNPSRKSKHHTKQSTFEGSRRQKRAEILRYILQNEEGVSLEEICTHLNSFEKKHQRAAVEEAYVQAIVDDLVQEGFFTWNEATERYCCNS